MYNTSQSFQHMIQGSNLQACAQTCIPPTVLFMLRPSKGLTAGFAPIPIIICRKKKRKEKGWSIILLFLATSESICILTKLGPISKCWG